MNGEKTKLYFERMTRVCDYIINNLDYNFSLDQLSQVANFSKFHFHRQFSEFVGISVFRFIQLMRLKQASYRLAFDKEQRIIDIAYDAQFENPESFSRAFKTTFGQTPTQFRKKPEWPTWHIKYQFDVPRKEGDVMLNVSIVEFKETKVALLEHRDSPDLVNNSARKFIEWRIQSKLSPVKTSQTYGIAYDDPKTTDPDRYQFDICGSVDQDVPDNPQGVKTSRIPGGHCAVVRHLGSHDKMDETVHYLYRD